GHRVLDIVDTLRQAAVGAIDEVVGEEVVVVGVGLGGPANVGQRDAVRLAGGEEVGAEVDQELVVHQRGGAIAQRPAADLACALAVVTAAEGIGVTFGGGGAEKRDLHGRSSFTSSNGQRPHRLASTAGVKAASLWN